MRSTGVANPLAFIQPMRTHSPIVRLEIKRKISCRNPNYTPTNLIFSSFFFFLSIRLEGGVRIGLLKMSGFATPAEQQGVHSEF
jgi:hypothetical protein